jgi:DNA-binding transcriptional LysR family regulator
MAAAMVADGRLVIVLDRFTPPPTPIQLVYPQARLLAPKIRAFIDFATPRVKQRLGEGTP